MKTKLLIAVLTGINFGLSAQVTDTGDKVGIGTTSPADKLTVNGNTRVIDPTNQNRFLLMHGNGHGNKIRSYGGNLLVETRLDSQDIEFKTNNSITPLMIVKGVGNVGIGTVNPKATLDINGSIKIKGGNQDFSISDIDDTDPIFGQYIDYGGIAINGNTGTNRQMFMFTDGESNDNIFTVATSQDSGNSWNSKFMIKQNGNVGIATNNPGTWKLAVNGKIRAKEIKVETGWSDFVFHDNYSLPTLEEVENHIKEKGHLKDIPSAKEVEENGIFLGEMDAKLLQKIEELTLYTIQQEKKINKLEKENQELKALANRISNIEQLLSDSKKQ